MLTDIHCHLLHGLDDGAASFEETQRMLLAARDNGASQIVATPHAVPGRQRFDSERCRAHLDMARTWCVQQGIPVALHEGAEIFYTDDTLRMLAEGKIPTLAGTRYVLLEFSQKAPYDFLCGAARKLGSAGYVPVFAHIERYDCLRNPQRIVRLKDEYQSVMQMNARTVVKPYGLLQKWWRDKVLRDGLIDVIASDAHNTKSRPCRLQEAYAWVEQHHGKDEALRLFSENPALMLCD